MTDYNYKATDCGARGKTFERDLKAYFHRRAVVSSAGKVDFRRYYKNVEAKTGASELGVEGGKLLKNCSYVLFAPIIELEQDFTKLEGFLVPREDFLECLEIAALIRHGKLPTAAYHGKPYEVKVSIQTFWNHKQGKPHGVKIFKLLDELYNRGYPTLQDYLEAGGKIQDLWVEKDED